MGMAVTESVGLVLCALETYLYPHTVLLGPQVAQGQKLAVETQSANALCID
jgi:hypothetical protein